MIAQASETFLSPMMLLWIVASGLAVLLLIGVAGRRKTSLTETLRDYVGQNQTQPKSNRDAPDSGTRADSDE